ncbi:MAG: polysaccharide deacetylase family protein [Ferruginibacter sp.]
MDKDASGKFIISLDFELMWGVRDVVTKETYGQHIKGVHQALPRILRTFTDFDIKATIAAVGFLFFRNKEELLNSLPELKPAYTDKNLSPYGDYIENIVGEDRAADPYHFGSHLIELIKQTPGQEIGTHTFSHYYCLEEGQTREQFRQDIEAAIAIGKKRNLQIQSIIFPRNQVNEDYLTICAEMGITSYRSNENSWLYKARSLKAETIFRRSIRLLDAYINLSGHHCYKDVSMKNVAIVNIPSSRFLRPYMARLDWFEGLRLKRIKKSMTHAAKHNLLYHIWWHPHNFGINQEKNIEFLQKILQHYQYLHLRYGFTNYTMNEYAEMLKAK